MEHSIVVLGTGRVAPGIAAAFARCGTVTIAGRDALQTEIAARAAGELAGTRVHAGPLAADTLRGATVVMETVLEDLAVKQELLRLIEPWISDEALVVTNTSSLPLEDIAAALRIPERFAAWHVMYPAHVTRVVEIVPGMRTSTATMETLLALAEEMGKRSILVRRAVPGYVINRIQMAVLRECLALVEEGVAGVDAVDAAVADALAPRWLAAGPLGTADAGNIETFKTVAWQLYPAIASGSVPAELLQQATKERGMYQWTDEERASLDDTRTAALAAGATIAARRPRPQPRA